MTDLNRTPLYDLHLAHGAKMVPFAGYEMPVQYAPGVMKEHLHVRSLAGLFDVSHMGQIEIRAKTGAFADAARALERLIPMDVAGLGEGRQRYGLFTNDAGGIRDDFMFANRGDHLFVVVNAACKDADLAYLQANLDDCDVTPIEDRALIALQGPVAAGLINLDAMTFMDVADVTMNGSACIVSRSGYTGEDGFEISVPADEAESLAAHLLLKDEIQPIGLGARDSLRLEAGLCLYGNDIDETTTPVEAALTWAIQKSRRRGGAREGGFPGADTILAQLDDGTDRQRVGISPQGRAPMRAGTQLFADDTSADPIGQITSGGFGPSVEAPVAMGYLPATHAAPDTQIFADLRGKRLPATVKSLPFIKPNYKR